MTWVRDAHTANYREQVVPAGSGRLPTMLPGAVSIVPFPDPPRPAGASIGSFQSGRDPMQRTAVTGSGDSIYMDDLSHNTTETKKSLPRPCGDTWPCMQNWWGGKASTKIAEVQGHCLRHPFPIERNQRSLHLFPFFFFFFLLGRCPNRDSPVPRLSKVGGGGVHEQHDLGIRGDPIPWQARKRMNPPKLRISALLATKCQLGASPTGREDGGLCSARTFSGSKGDVPSLRAWAAGYGWPGDNKPLRRPRASDQQKGAGCNS